MTREITGSRRPLSALVPLMSARIRSANQFVNEPSMEGPATTTMRADSVPLSSAGINHEYQGRLRPICVITRRKPGGAIPTSPPATLARNLVRIPIKDMVQKGIST